MSGLSSGSDEGGESSVVSAGTFNLRGEHGRERAPPKPLGGGFKLYSLENGLASPALLGGFGNSKPPKTEIRSFRSWLSRDEDRTCDPFWRRELPDDLPMVEYLCASGRSSGVFGGCLDRNSSRAAMREVFGRMKDGEGNESSAGWTGLVGALEGAVDASLEAADVLRFEKNFSSLSSPLAMVIDSLSIGFDYWEV